MGLGLLAVAFLGGNTYAIATIAIFLGAIAGFLVFNLPPAKVFMGNSGSHFLGFTLAAISLMLSYAPLEKKVALFSPLLIAGLPIFDTSFLILMRLLKARSIFKKSNDHLAMRFLKDGHSPRRTLFIMLSLALVSCIAGVCVIILPNPLSTLIVIPAIGFALGMLFKMSKVSIDG
jgi:UDP-GlcNAc:undecaprenyl-phosphate GlcNAc-1-phosphate transferase